MSPAPEASDGEGAAAPVHGAAKWLISAFAAIGAVLVAGLQLGAVGSLSWDDDPGRVAAVVVSAVIALTITGLVIIYASRVLVGFNYTLDDLVALETEARNEYAQVTDLGKRLQDPLEYDSVLKNLIGRPHLMPSQIRTPLELRDALAQARQQPAGAPPVGGMAAPTLEELEAGVLRLTGFVELAQCRQKYKRLTGWILPALLGVATCIFVFSWGINSNKGVQITRPTTVTLVLKNPSKADLKKVGLGEGCKLKRLQAVAIDGPIAEPKVVTMEDSGGCRPAKFTMNAHLGFVVPKVSSASQG
ncbi:hypothetical protein [Streptomyces asiaticus]|uniref:hypothetical protein n=1 Tax=Streptomyces asiaticus TaxID=114695 RepID=UPI003F66CE48